MIIYISISSEGLYKYTWVNLGFYLVSYIRMKIKQGT